MTIEEIFNTVNAKTISQQFAEATYFLNKEVGLTYTDIYGEREVVTVDEEISRDGIIGSLLDDLIGRRTRQRTKIVRSPGMNVKTFLTYLQLMNDHAEKQEREAKKSEMRSNLGGL